MSLAGRSDEAYSYGRRSYQVAAARNQNKESRRNNDNNATLPQHERSPMESGFAFAVCFVVSSSFAAKDHFLLLEQKNLPPPKR